MMETDVTPIAAPICCNVAVNPEAIPTSSGFTFSNTKHGLNKGGILEYQVNF